MNKKYELESVKLILPYDKGLTSDIGRILQKMNFKPINKPVKTIRIILGNSKYKVQVEKSKQTPFHTATAKIIRGKHNGQLATKRRRNNNSIIPKVVQIIGVFLV